MSMQKAVDLMLSGEFEAAATMLRAKGYEDEANAVLAGAMAAKTGRYNFREQCIGAWKLDRDLLRKVWDRATSDEEREGIRNDVFGAHPEWWDRSVKMNRKGPFWSKPICGNMDPSGQCAFCKKREQSEREAAREQTQTHNPFPARRSWEPGSSMARKSK